VPDIVATLGLLLEKLTLRPVSVLPLASFSVMVACVPWPTTRLEELSETTSDATGALATIKAAAALTPSLVAMMPVPPTRRPWTTPESFTTAIAVSPLDHWTARPVSGFPLASLGMATSRAVLLTASETWLGCKTIDATDTWGGPFEPYTVWDAGSPLQAATITNATPALTRLRI
jgi:hypothetical protein